ncbi:MAG: DUF5723 family protein [Bacteroidales bacterium]|nr:DUF5723 family protein [Bacteroidales bacterium]MCF8402464.1 DUF5723 family protein [Bacteroidales bacterium]
MAKLTLAQHADFNHYFPGNTSASSHDGIEAVVFVSEAANSNVISNGFIKKIRNSEFLDASTINQEINNFNDGKALSGTIRSLGAGIWIPNKNKSLTYYLGYQHQQFLDSYLDETLISLLLKGNGPYAGEVLQMPLSSYYGIYFNQVKGGVKFEIKSQSSVVHQFSAKAGLAFGQNYNWYQLTNSSFYTQPDGDYLQVDIVAETRLSDTAWAEVTDINGFGASMDINYGLYNPNKFYLGLNVNNLGFINWNGNPFTASMDTSFVFEGLSNDTISGINGRIPDDFSYDNLRRLFFKTNDDAPFSQALPLVLNVSGGFFLNEEQWYIGINGFYYPTLEANYKLEFFTTWNHKGKFQFTPIGTYSSYEKINFGLAFGITLTDKVYLSAGSQYLNSVFSESAVAGTGGFLRLTFLL